MEGPTDFGPPAPLFRKEFNVKGKVTSAVAYVTGLGYFELYLNGEKVGDDLLVPNQTNYGKRPELADALIPLPDHFREYKVMYLAYDVKDQLEGWEPMPLGGSWETDSIIRRNSGPLLMDHPGFCARFTSAMTMEVKR